MRRLTSGAFDYLRGDLTGALVTQDAHARLQEAVLSGNVWIGANPAGTPVTTQAGLSATTPALTLFNPLNSPVNLVLWTVTINVTTAAQASFELGVNFPNVAGVPTGPGTLTNANVFNALLATGVTGSTTAITTQGQWGQCYRVATLSATPLAFMYLGSSNFTAAGSGAGGTSVSPVAYGWQTGVFPIDGGVIIPPGVAISIQTSAAVACVASFVWEEVPIVK